jgi:hypothetical protein
LNPEKQVQCITARAPKRICTSIDPSRLATLNSSAEIGRNRDSNEFVTRVSVSPTIADNNANVSTLSVSPVITAWRPLLADGGGVAAGISEQEATDGRQRVVLRLEVVTRGTKYPEP